MSISAKIDRIIQQANQTKLYEDHWKLIATTLTNIRNNYNDKITTSDENCILQNEFQQTLKLIDEVVTSFHDNENSLDGMTSRDMEALLLRFHYQLVKCESEFTDDYELRIQILSKGCQEQEVLSQKSWTDTIKPILERFEPHTKENTKEQLDELRQKHAKIIESYLRTCSELHQNESVSEFISYDNINKIMNIFYQVSNNEPITLEEQQKQKITIPIKRKLYELKLDEAMVYVRNESQQLHVENSQNSKDTSQRPWKHLMSVPGILKNINNITEENVIRTKRWIMILGDPSSGKTCFVRSIVHLLAQNVLSSEQYTTEYGPLRLPILIRVREFANLLKEQPSLTLFDYIGKHQWMEKAWVDDSSISPEELSCTLHDYIQQGQALIILDGLNEIINIDERSKVIKAIEDFANTHVQIPSNTSDFDNVHMSKLFDDPSRSGGNQLIVTSRQDDYYTVSLNGKFTRCTIQPLAKKSISEFVDYWFSQVHQSIIRIFNISSESQATKHSQMLKKQLETTNDSSLIKMTSNIGLLSLICAQCFNQSDGLALPNQSFRQYELIIKSFIDLQNRRTPINDPSQITRILSEIAYFILQKPESNLISIQEIKEICARTSMTTNETDDIEQQIIHIICNDSGILVLQDKSLYGFLHAAFQQYFTCLKLIEGDLIKARKKFITDMSDRDNRIQRIAQLLSRHVNDQQFRIPITLAFGKISSLWSQNDFDDVCYEFLQIENECDSLLPVSSYVLINSVDNFVNFPSNEILFNALNHLIIAAGRNNCFVNCPFLLEQMTNILRKFPNSLVSLWIQTFLSEAAQHDTQSIRALCQFIEGKSHEFDNIQRWLDPSICSMFQSLLKLDNEKNGFAIDRLLIKIAFSKNQLLTPDSNDLKMVLVDTQTQINSIPNELLSLVIILYGGLKRDGQLVVFDPAHIHRQSVLLAPYLIEFFCTQDLEKIKQDCIKEFDQRLTAQDESLETIDLCLAMICLNNIEYVQENINRISKNLLHACMQRLKYSSMILRQFYFTADRNDQSLENETTKFISTSIETFQNGEGARIQFVELLNSLRSSLARLRTSTKSILFDGISKPYKRATLILPKLLRRENLFLNDLLRNDLQFYSERRSCSFIYTFNKLFWLLDNNYEFGTEYRMSTAGSGIPKYLILRRDEDILTTLTFIPSHLRNLYVQLLKENFIMIHPNGFGNNEHLYFGHILLECLFSLSNASCAKTLLHYVLVTLLPWLRIQYLDNFGSSLLWIPSLKDSTLLHSYEKTKKRAINFETGRFLDTNEILFTGRNLSDDVRTKIIQTNIDEDCRKIQNVERKRETYAASISLAHICHWTENDRKLSLLEQSIRGAMSLENKLARLDALCAIALYSYSDYYRIQVSDNRSLQVEIQDQLKEIYPTLPVLLQTAIFIRCLPLLEPSQLVDDCLQNICEKLVNAEKRDQEVVVEALSPYLKLRITFSSLINRPLTCLQERTLPVDNRSSALKKYFNKDASFSVSISNFYIMELTNDLNEFLKTDYRDFTIDESMVTKLFEFDRDTLSVEQASIITDMITCFMSSTNQPENLLTILSNALHRIRLIEFKACRIVESWLKWKDSDQLSCFAYHAAFLLINSDIWSVEATEIFCDLLSNENDCFRYKAERFLYSSSTGSVRTSSKLGIDVLLTIVKKKVQHRLKSISAFENMKILIRSIKLDIQFHLETLLWLERYRIHALIDKEYSYDKLRSTTNSYVNSFFSTDIAFNACNYTDSFRYSNDMVIRLCDMLALNFPSFCPIDGCTTPEIAAESHTRFVVSTLLNLHGKLNNNKETQDMVIMTSTNLFDLCDNDLIREAIAYLLGYVCDERTYKVIYEKIILVLSELTLQTSGYSERILSAFIKSYSYCVSRSKVKLGEDELRLFSKLLTHESKDIVTAVRTGFGHVFRDATELLRKLNFDYGECYHALIASTASCYSDSIQTTSEFVTSTFVRDHTSFLPVFMIEFCNYLQRLTNGELRSEENYYEIAYSYPTYMTMATQIALLMPTELCKFIEDWRDKDEFKRVLLNACQLSHYSGCTACITILSLLGELTVELCQMLVQAVRNEPYLLSTCYKSITNIRSIKDETEILNLLISYVKSKSMIIRYITVKILLHLSSLRLIQFKQVHTILNDLILDPNSNEELWLIGKRDGESTKRYYYAGQLKNVVQSLLIQHIIDHSRQNDDQRNESNDIDWDFICSQKASRFAVCSFEQRTSSRCNLQ